MPSDEATAALYEQHSGRLFGLAYRMLGSVTEAEDVVQDVFVRWSAIDQSEIREPAAWLTTAATRLCLDRAKSAQHQRERYFGPWLPEPLATEAIDPADLAGTADSLTFAFLVVLESLSPLERAVFVLHEVFGHPHADIAGMLGRSDAAVRQIARRARRHLHERRSRYEPGRDRQRAVTDAFLSACAGGNLATMLELLAPDVTFTGDGGGIATATRRPVRGAERVAKMFFGFWRTGQDRGLSVDVVEVNAGPGLRVRDGDATDSVMCFEVDGRIAAIRAVRNPAKLVGFERLRAAPPPARTSID